MLREPVQTPEVVLIATGSEVSLPLKQPVFWPSRASLPGWFRCPVLKYCCSRRGLSSLRFAADLRARVAGAVTPIRGLSMLLDGAVVGIDRFGLSAPGQQSSGGDGHDN